MIFVALIFDIVRRLLAKRPLVFSRNSFCPAAVHGLKSPVNGFSSQIVGAAAMITGGRGCCLQAGGRTMGKISWVDVFEQGLRDIQIPNGA